MEQDKHTTKNHWGFRWRTVNETTMGELGESGVRSCWRMKRLWYALPLATRRVENTNLVIPVVLWVQKKLPVIFSEEMRTSGGKILGDVHSRACGSRNLWKWTPNIHRSKQSEGHGFLRAVAKEYILMRCVGQSKNFCNSPEQWGFLNKTQSVSCDVGSARRREATVESRSIWVVKDIRDC
jgi:hypothetical protein